MTTNPSDTVVSYLRTFVPIAWGWVISFVLTHWDWAANLITDLNVDLNSTAVVTFITAVVTAGWYALWRWLEPRIPNSIVTILLGSAKQPVYPPTPDSPTGVTAPGTGQAPGM